VVIDLGHGGAMSPETLLTQPVRLNELFVNVRLVTLHPGQEGRTEIEVYLGIIIDNIDDAHFRVQDARSGVGAVALGGDPFVPIVKRLGRILHLDFFQPGILPRRLVKMAMNANVTIHAHPSFPQ